MAMQEACPSDIDIILGIAGPDVTARLVEEFAGQSVYIPKNYAKRSVHDEVVADYNAGFSYKELARKYHFTVSWVREICKKSMPTGPRNLDLFAAESQ